MAAQKRNSLASIRPGHSPHGNGCCAKSARDSRSKSHSSRERSKRDSGKRTEFRKRVTREMRFRQETKPVMPRCLEIGPLCSPMGRSFIPKMIRSKSSRRSSALRSDSAEHPCASTTHSIPFIISHAATACACRTPTELLIFGIGLPQLRQNFVSAPAAVPVVASRPAQLRFPSSRRGFL